ncbi:MAG: HAMP domain-containing histidine kinase [Clostridiales bacterium]|nr:HAMP domain-containing histidine kinase [Clostridiales bacterium]
MIWEIIAIVLIAVVLALTMMLISLFSQVKNLQSQVHFIAKNRTNKTVTFYGKSREMTTLSKDINEVILSCREREQEVMKQDNEIRDTLTNMSHDIRTPLTSLKGYFELLSESDDPAEQEKYRNIISERIDSLGEILEEMFFYTKVSNINYNVSVDKIPFSDIAMQTLFSYYEDFEKAGMDPHIDIEEGLNAIGNEQSVKRILQNLVKNCLVHGKGDVNISLKSEGEKHVAFTISNSVDPDRIPDPTKVFDRFYKGDPSRHVSSSGIGLSVAKKLVDSMHGTIDAYVEGEVFGIKMRLPSI